MLLAVALGACPREQAPDPVDDRERFRQELIAEALRHSPDASIQLGERVEDVTIDGTPLFLGNMYATAREGLASREATIRNTIDTLRISSIGAVIPERFELARDHLLPRLRDVASRGITVLDMELRTDAGVTPPVERPLTDHLREVLVFDRPSGVIDLPRSIASKWGRSDDELFAIAHQNLERLSGGLVEANGLLVSNEGDTYDAARVVLVDAAEEAKGGYPITLQPIIHTDGGWQRWLPTNRELAGRVAALRRADLLETYGEQKELLDALHERNQVDVFVASLLEKDGRTFVTWSMGVRAWLAEADDVIFISGTDAKPSARLTSFAKAKKVMGNAMRQVPDLEPPRWEVNSFPTERQLRAMKATVLTPKRPR